MVPLVIKCFTVDLLNDRHRTSTTQLLTDLRLHVITYTYTTNITMLNTDIMSSGTSPSSAHMHSTDQPQQSRFRESSIDYNCALYTVNVNLSMTYIGEEKGQEG